MTSQTPPITYESGISASERTIQRNRFARTHSRFMYGLCVGFTLLILSILTLVVGYLVSIGWRSVSLDFFTKVPMPYGAQGYPGGMLSGLVGTVVLIAMSSAVGIPIGMLAGIFLADYGANSKLAAPVGFTAS